MTLASAIYEGVVRHRRFEPRGHEFRMPLFMMYLDLAELDRVFSGSWLWSARRLAPAWWRRADYLGEAGEPIEASVRRRIEQSGAAVPRGPIRMLTHLRYFGYCFNPVTFYYCFDAAGARVESIVAEITNTPWNERHAYVLREAERELPPSAHRRDGDGAESVVAAQRPLRFRFEKDFHVSPFMPMDLGYDWAFTPPGERLFVQMNLLRRDSANSPARMFDATLDLTRREISPAALRGVLLRYPLMTAAVITRIHWEALRLWMKRVPIHSHPKSARPARTTPADPVSAAPPLHGAHS